MDQLRALNLVITSLDLVKTNRRDQPVSDDLAVDMAVLRDKFEADDTTQATEKLTLFAKPLLLCSLY